MKNSRILVTGAAGFIGFHLSQKLIGKGAQVIGIDNLNDYYDPALKDARLAELKKETSFSFQKMDVADAAAVKALFAKEKFNYVVHLAAQAGVRHSLTAPQDYIDSNITGFLNILEGCRAHPVKHLLYASSSSVYGSNRDLPFSEEDRVDHPTNLYGVSKKCNELMAYAYSHLFGIPTSGLRFFTVYGPWGRPDMAMYLFTNAIVNGTPMRVFNNGDMIRDFTYVEDIVEPLSRLVTAEAPSTDGVPYAVYNIGGSHPCKLMDLIRMLEKKLGKPGVKTMEPMQDGDIYATAADVSRLQDKVDYTPQWNLDRGVEAFLAWYRAYHNISSSQTREQPQVA